MKQVELIDETKVRPAAQAIGMLMKDYELSPSEALIALQIVRVAIEEAAGMSNVEISLGVKGEVN